MPQQQSDNGTSTLHLAALAAAAAALGLGAGAAAVYLVLKREADDRQRRSLNSGSLRAATRTGSRHHSGSTEAVPLFDSVQVRFPYPL